MEKIKVDCPVCKHVFEIRGGMSIQSVKANSGPDASAPLRVADFSCCTKCFTPVQYGMDGKWHDVSGPEKWTALSLDERSLLKKTQDMLKNRAEKDPFKQMLGAISGQQLSDEPEGDEHQKKAALIQVSLTVAVGVLKKNVKDDEGLEKSAMKAIQELTQIALVGVDEFAIQVRLMVASSIALSIVEGRGSRDAAVKHLEHALSVAEKDARKRGVHVLNMSDRIPNDAA